MKFKLLVAATSIALASCLSIPVLAQMQIEQAVIRAMPPGQIVTAAYMLISNHTDQSRTLVSASSELGSHVEMHENTMEAGVMRMRQLEAVEIPSHGSTMFGAQGRHFMIFNLNHDLVEGESHSMVFTYDDGSTQTVEAVVTKILPAHGKAEHDHSTMHKVTPTKAETHSHSE
ncbi:MAG: copper(I)-binding protein [Saprospiraceae bacterium]|jgi:copper(I)-binding protein